MKMNNFELAKQRFTEGIDCLNGGRYEEAERQFQQSLTILPDRVSTLTNLATTQILLKKFAEARVSAEAALSIEPKSFEGWLNLGRAERGEARDREAVEAFRQAITIGGPAGIVWKLMAGAYDGLGDVEATLQCYQAALALDGHDLEALAGARVPLRIELVPARRARGRTHLLALEPHARADAQPPEHRRVRARLAAHHELQPRHEPVQRVRTIELREPRALGGLVRGGASIAERRRARARR
jgi:tetratricopeptide (TPR) repeat protein